MRVADTSQSAAPFAPRPHVGPWPWYLSAADFIGLDVDLVDDIAGDLLEECAARTASHGGVAARLWCAAQLLRSLPHLALSTFRRGHRRARLRLIGTLCTVLLAATAVVAAMKLRDGPPARILADRGDDADGIVINNIKPVVLPIRVLDARGHRLESVGVHYERVAGDHIDISPAGVLTCRTRGDATVRASLADVVSIVTVRCRPVKSIRAASWADFVPGDAPRAIPFVAVDADDRVVNQLRGSITISDSTIATLNRSTLTPRAIGVSGLTITVGDQRVQMAVIVYEPVKRFDNLTPAQRNMAIIMRVERGDTIEYPIPRGTMWVKWMPSGGTGTPPTIRLEGPGSCQAGQSSVARWLPIDEYGAYCYVGTGARLRVAHGAAGPATLSGALMIERTWQ